MSHCFPTVRLTIEQPELQHHEQPRPNDVEQRLEGSIPIDEAPPQVECAKFQVVRPEQSIQPSDILGELVGRVGPLTNH